MTERGTSSPSGEHVAIGPLVRGIFARFEWAGVCWAVLRNAEGLPDFTRHDIDLLIDPRHISQARQIIQAAAEQSGWGVLAHLRKDRYDCYVLMSGGESGAGRRILPIDLVTACEYRGKSYADAAFALSRRRRVGEMAWAVPAGFEAATTVVKELLPHGVLKENSRAAVRQGAEEDASGFEYALAACFGTQLARQLCYACQQGEWQQVEGLTIALRRVMRRVSVERWLHRPAFLWRNLVLHLKPPMSAFVVLLGPDGSGKTTIGEGLCERMYHRPFKVCRPMAFNFRIVPELKRLKGWARWLIGRRAAASEPSPSMVGVQHSGMKRPMSTMRAMAYVAYYSVDLLLGRLVVRRWRAQSSLIVFARYFHDYYYQLGYSRAPRWFLRVMELLVAKPDLLVYLDRDAEEIYAGKPELTLEEIRRQQDVLRRVLEGRGNARVIDARGGVEATIERVEETIWKRVLRRGGGPVPSRATGSITPLPESYRVVQWCGRPLVAVPASGPAAQRRAAVRCYPAPTWKRAMVRGGLRMMVGSGIERVWRETTDLPIGGGRALSVTKWLDQVRADGVARDGGVRAMVIWPRQASRARLHVHLVDEGGHRIGFAKIGLNAEHNARIEAEANAMRSLLGAHLHYSHVPGVLAEGTYEGHRYLVTEALLPHADAASDSTPFPRNAVHEYAGPPTALPMAQIGQLSWWIRFQSRATEVPAFAKALDGAAAGVDGLEVCRVHGDLGSENLFYADYQLWIVDWETSDTRGPRLTDEVAFWLGRMHRAVLRDPRAGLDAFLKTFLATGAAHQQIDVLMALAFLHGAQFNVATAMIGAWDR